MEFQYKKKTDVREKVRSSESKAHVFPWETETFLCVGVQLYRGSYCVVQYRWFYLLALYRLRVFDGFPATLCPHGVGPFDGGSLFIAFVSFVSLSRAALIE